MLGSERKATCDGVSSKLAGKTVLAGEEQEKEWQLWELGREPRSRGEV